MLAVAVLLWSACVGALLARPGLEALRAGGLVRENHRGVALPVAAGAVALVAGLVAVGPLALLDLLLAGDEVLAPGTGAVLLFGVGVGLLGLLDDVLGSPEARGWRGHGAALLAGRLSPGVLKAAGTASLALFVLAEQRPAGEALLGAAVLTLAAHVFNLLDLRPGRAAKAWALLALGLLAGTLELGPLHAVAPLAAPLLVMGLWWDLRERAMLGDAGSTVLGALAGLWLVLALGVTGQAIALAVLAAVTVYGEWRSISEAIERLPPLRVLDSLGRPE